MLHCNPRLVNNKLYTLDLNHNDSIKIFFVCWKFKKNDYFRRNSAGSKFNPKRSKNIIDPLNTVEWILLTRDERTRVSDVCLCPSPCPKSGLCRSPCPSPCPKLKKKIPCPCPNSCPRPKSWLCPSPCPKFSKRSCPSPLRTWTRTRTHVRSRVRVRSSLLPR